jgi:(S)-ureidoglycine aminohydrolase
MHELGLTRSVRRHDHAVFTADTFVRAALPGMKKAAAIIHAAPAIGAGFTQYTAEMESGGCLGDLPASCERFLYVIDGKVSAGFAEKAHTLTKDDYAYIPQQLHHSVVATTESKLAIVEKRYLPLDGVRPPAAFSSRASSVASEPLEGGDETVAVRHLLPDDMAFDCAVNVMTYQPGATLPMVEIHVMEHGLLMLEGGGIYRLGEHWYPVAAGDFIWMGPYCPQWFGALGKGVARYLIYKDWNRHPLT